MTVLKSFSGRIVEIARTYDLFIIFDETYHHIVFNGKTMDTGG